MEVHTNSKYSDLLSEKQWAEKGRMLNDNVQGKEMWINSHHQGTMLYYDETQTHKASPDELEQYRVQIKLNATLVSVSREQGKNSVTRSVSVTLKIV